MDWHAGTPDSLIVQVLPAHLSSSQVLKRVPQYVFALHMLFPTISHMAQTPNGKRLSPLFSSWALRPVFYSTSALSYLPTGLSSRLVSLLTGQSGSGAQTTTQLVSSPETVVAALVMARNELAQVTELDREALREHGGKVWIYWAAEGVDGWVTEEAVKEVEEVLEEKFGEEGRKRRKRCEEGMPHAFVLSDGESAPLFSLTRSVRFSPLDDDARRRGSIDERALPRSPHRLARPQVRRLDRRGRRYAEGVD